MNSGRPQPLMRLQPASLATATTAAVDAPSLAASAASNINNNNSNNALQNWCQQGISPEGLREFRVSMEGMTIGLANQLAGKLNKSELFAKLGVYGTAPPDQHDEIMRILFSCIEQSKSIFCLSLSSPMGGNAKRFSQHTLSCLKSLYLTSETMTLDMAQEYLQQSLIHNTSIQDFTMEFRHDANSKRIFDMLMDSVAQRQEPLHKLCVVHEENLDATEEEEDEEDLESEHRLGILGSVREIIQLHKCPNELEWIGCDVVAKDLQVLATYLRDTPDCRLQALAINDCVNKLCHVSCLAQALAHNTSLLRLHLDCDQLDDADIQDLADGLVHNTTLQALHVCGNRITDEGIIHFCQLWRETSAIQQMDMGFNFFGPPGARELLRAVAAHPRMQSLSLIQNDNFNYQGLQWIGEELPNVSLKTLSVSCVVNEDVIIQDEEDEDNEEIPAHGDTAAPGAGAAAAANPAGGADRAVAVARNPRTSADAQARKAQQHARQLAGQALLQGIQANVTLRDLDISYNKFTPELENEIRFYVELNQRGRCFLSNFFELPPALIARLLHKCGDDPKYMYYLIREQPLLVTRIVNQHYEDQEMENEDAAITMPPRKRHRT